MSLWQRIKSTGGVGVYWVLGLLSGVVVLLNTLELPWGNVLTKAGFIGIGFVFNTLALIDRRRVWVGWMIPGYAIGILRDLFWQERIHWPSALIFMALTLLIPITYFSIPSHKRKPSL